MKFFLRKIFFLTLFTFSINYSNACSIVTGLHTTFITQTTATLNWNTAVCDSFLVRYFIAGTNDVHFRIVNSGTAVNIIIDSLYPNTNYSWLIHTYCNGGQQGIYQLFPATFTTAIGNVSCIPPNLLDARNIGPDISTVAWNSLVDADSFLVRYHVSNTADFIWRNIPGVYHSVTLHNLMPSSIYEWEVRSFCNGNDIHSNLTDTFVTNCDTLPAPDHIVICIMENKGYPQIIDSFAIAPYINALAYDPLSALFTQSYALAHPSQPNYLDFFSGSNQGITNNNVPASHFTTPNLARSLLDAGKTFVTYSQNLPYTGSDTIRSGNYERKHNPVANWMGTGINQVPDTCSQPFTNFPTDFNLLPTVSYVIPDQANDMHNGTITAGDTWVATNLDAYVQWAKANNSLFILTFDEDNASYNNRIVTIFCGPMVNPGQYSKFINHYSVLRTIEDMYALKHAGHSVDVASVKECWKPILNSVANQNSQQLDWAVYGYGVTGELNVDYTLPSTSIVAIQVFTSDGKMVYESSGIKQLAGLHHAILNPLNHSLSNGIYIVRLVIDDRSYSKKVVMVY
ncbi:MAG: alkaline phosphatase family protein [Bacteroidota bacterium]